MVATRITALALLATLAACGSEDGRGGAARAEDPAARITNRPASSASTEPATARGLAAAVIAHLGDTRVLAASGGLTDMEDTRGLEVDLRLGLGRGRNHLAVQAADPSYLPKDRGDISCADVEGAEEAEPGTSVRCTVLDDGTTVLVVASEHGFSDDNAHGSAAVAMVSGPDRELQLMYETYDRDGALDPDLVMAIAADPLVGWRTSAALNDAGADLPRFRQRDRVDR